MSYSLSPIDYYFYRRSLYSIQFVFEYAGEVDLARLRRAIESQRATFPRVFSRIRRVSDRDLVLVPSAAEIPVVSNGERITPIENLPDFPLVRFSVSDGGGRAYLGVSFSHLLGDGFSFTRFLRAISGSCLGIAAPERVDPDRDPFTRASPNPAVSYELYESTGYVTPRPPDPPATRTEYEQVTRQEIELIRAAEGARGLSVNDHLMARLIKRYAATIPLSPDGKLLIRCPVDIRRRYPGVPVDYFGNAFKDAIAAFEPDDFPRLTLTHVARQIRNAIDGVAPASVDRAILALDRFRQQNGVDAFEAIGCPGLLVSNLSRFPFSEIDLGAGAPIAVHHASLNPRLAVILAAPDGGYEIRVRVPSA